LKKIVSILIVALLTLFFACEKSNDGNIQNLNSKWEVTTFSSIESVAYPKDNNYNPIIEFRADGTFSLKPDVNQCGGSFSTSGEDQISISASACTKICCDSPFSQKVIEMLPLVESFYIEGKALKLIVPEWGWMELRALE